MKIPPVIPHPVKITLNKGNFFLSKETFIDISPRLQASGNILQKVLVDDIGLECRISKETYSSNCINLRLNDKLSNLGKEGYSLIIDTEKILIQGAHERGLYYAIQTLRQLIPLSPIETAVWPIQGIQIVDYPRFRWRGFMLDEGRHFQGKTIVKRMLDLMALH
ncbi:glycoside hydrolase family 20 zincin-like fold domain-containing protein, partial [Candidatus Hodarchaeum mangrovi]